MKRIVFALVLLSVIPLISKAQQDDLSKYFDDGGGSNKNRLAKFGVDLFNGEYFVSYEQELIRNMSIEGTMGVLSASRQYNRFEDDGIREFSSSGLGFFFAANVRLYFKEYYERWYIGFQPKFNIVGGKLFTDIVFFNGGYQLPLQKNLVLDFNLGMAVRSYKYTDQITTAISYSDRNTHFYFPASIKLGYAF